MKYLDAKTYKYLIIFAIFLLVYIYGKNLNTLPNGRAILPSDELEEEILPKIAFLTQKSNISMYKNPFTRGNGYYRLSVQAKYIPDPAIISREDVHPKTSDLDIYLASKNGEKKKITTVRLYSDKFSEWSEVLLDATSDQDILFSKSLDKDGAIYVDGLNITKIDSIDNVKPTVFGQMSMSRIFDSDIRSEAYKPVFKFSRRNQAIGVIYKAEKSDNIAVAKIKMNKIGNGGNGNYQLKVQEVNLINGKYVLYPQMLASSFFKAKDLKNYAQAGEDEIFNIPLPAFTEKGKHYFVGLDNSAVSFNTINTIEVFGKDNKPAEFATFSKIGKGNLNEESYSGYIDLFSANEEMIDGQKKLYNSIVEDVGNGVGKYTYQNSGSYLDYLNINEVPVNDKAKNIVFYDQVQEGISGTASSGTAFIYKFHSPYPFTSMVIEAKSVGGEFNPVKMWFSYDRENWLEINPVFNKKEIFSKSIDVPAEKTVYLKVSYGEKPGAGQKIFGLSSLKVSGDLSIK